MAYDRLPDLYECLTSYGDGTRLPTISTPGLGDLSFLNCYENTYGRLYRRLLQSKGFSCEADFSIAKGQEVLGTLLDLHRTRKAYLFPKAEQSIHNPLLVDCEPIRSLINNWLHDSDHCAFASNGLMY